MPENPDNTSHTPLLRPSTDGRVLLTRAPDVEYIFDLALEETRNMIQAKHANLYLYDEDGGLLPYHESLDPPGVKALAEYCGKNRVSVNYHPHQTHSPAEAERPIDFEVGHAAVCVFLSLRDGDLGVLVLHEPRYFGEFYEADLSLLKNFAAAFCIMLNNGFRGKNEEEIYLTFKTSLLLLIENAHLQQQIKDANYRLSTVLDVSNLINSSRELNEMIEMVLYSCRRVMRAESASLFLVDEETGELYFDIVANKSDAGLKGFRIPQGQGIVGLSAQQKKSIVVNDAENDPRIYRAVDEAAKNVTRNLIASPLLIADKCIGVIEVINTIDRPSFSQNDLDLFESFSDSVAIALQRRTLLDELQQSNEELEKRLRETTTLHEVARALVDAQSVQDMFEQVLRIITDNLSIKRLSILLYNESSESLELRASSGEYSKESHTESLDSSLSGLAFRENRQLFINDLEKDPDYQEFHNEERYSTGSCILVPLTGSKSKEPFGVFCAADPDPGLFSKDDVQLLSTLATQIVRGVENFRLNEEILARQAIEKEVEITSRIQKNILPPHAPEHLHIQMSGRSVMARTTGGDFYDFFVESHNGPVTMLVADVSGKSLPAALFMAVSSSILRTIMRFETEPTKILARANDLLYEESESGMFVTVFLARYEPATNRLRYASAGHNGMFLLHVDGTHEVLAGKGHPLGVVPSYQQRYSGGEIAVHSNDQLILYTDGVVEATNPKDEEYGEDRFLSQLQTNIYRNPDELIEHIYQHVVSFSGSDLQYDDFTMLITRFHGVIEENRSYNIALPANKSSIPRLRDWVMQNCMNHGMAGNDLDDILLVSDEAATNIVIHAYNGGADAEFECDLEIEPDRILKLTFLDRGQKFDFTRITPPNLEENLAGKRKGGFGVYLMRSLMDKVEYVHKEGVNYLIAERSLKKNLR